MSTWVCMRNGQVSHLRKTVKKYRTLIWKMTLQRFRAAHSRLFHTAASPTFHNNPDFNFFKVLIRCFSWKFLQYNFCKKTRNDYVSDYYVFENGSPHQLKLAIFRSNFFLDVQAFCKLLTLRYTNNDTI